MISFQYKVFYQVATNLSFSKAAKLLFISQPAVSTHIKKLEAEMGVPLFHRKGNTIILTESGQKLLEHLVQAFRLEKSIQSDIDQIKDHRELTGELRLGSSTTLSLYVLPKVMSSFHKRFPNIQLFLINRNTENILKALVNNEIDLAIVESRYDITSVHVIPFIQDEIIPICSYSSPYAAVPITIDEMAALPMVMRERGSGTLAVIMEEFERKKLKQSDLKITARLGGTEALKNYLLEDEALGFLSRLAVVRELESKALREVDVKSLKLKRKFNFVMRKGDENLTLVKSFINEAKFHYNF